MHRDRRIAAMWADGMSYTQIGDALGQSKGAIAGRIKRLGLPRRKPDSPYHKRYTPEQIAEMIRLSNDGHGLREIARRMGIGNNQTVKRHIDKFYNPALPAGYAPSNGLPDTLRAGPVVEILSVPSPARIIAKTRQVEYLNRTKPKRQSISIGPPPRTCQFPYGERPHYNMCGVTVAPGRPYCAEHTSLCYVKLKPLMLVPRQPKESFADLKW